MFPICHTLSTEYETSGENSDHTNSDRNLEPYAQEPAYNPLSVDLSYLMEFLNEITGLPENSFLDVTDNEVGLNDSIGFSRGSDDLLNEVGQCGYFSDHSFQVLTETTCTCNGALHQENWPAGTQTFQFVTEESGDHSSVRNEFITQTRFPKEFSVDDSETDTADESDGENKLR
ncbi:hypothetical protein JCM33374_g1202 [Metschnikowia sp. JCM 33374]|nr:hypothetical protein JCM33374_g1202 [Metschnikowia sp. JCM 33374]